MWTYTSYILWKLFKKTAFTELKFSELRNFVFNTLWRGQGVVFHSDAKDLYLDLKFLEKRGILEIEENEILDKTKIKVKDQEKLKKTAKFVENLPSLAKLDVLHEYAEKINKAIESIKELEV